MTAGVRLPFWSRVLSLYCLTKSMMGTPCWPKTGPTGGAGVASPAGRLILRTILTFLATVFGLYLFNLEEVEFDGGFPAKDTDQDTQFAVGLVDTFDAAQKVGEGAVGNLDGFAQRKVGLVFGGA